MKYAHVGDSADNAMSIGIDGKPVRTFVAFANASDRKQFQDDTWAETGGMRNVRYSRDTCKKYR